MIKDKINNSINKTNNSNKDNDREKTQTFIYITTYQYRIKDSNKALDRALFVLSSKVNFIWNFINHSQQQVVDRNNAGGKYKFWLNKLDLHDLTKGTSKLINLPAQTIQSINEEYVTRRVNANKPYLKFRTNKKNRNLPWIPFKTQDIKVDNNGTFTFCGLKLKTFYSRNLPDNIKVTNGSVVRDNLGHWFINITFKKELTEEELLNLTSSGQNKTGIDPGLNPFLTKCIEMPLTKEEIESNFNNCNETQVYTKIVYEEINPERFYRNNEEKLAKAQRARRFNQARKVSKKIKNQRKDFLHKLSTNLVQDNSHIVMGIVDLKRLISKGSLKGHSKSWTDNGLGMLRVMLKTKAHKHNMEYTEVEERKIKSTQTCSCCGKITGPRGLEGLSVSRWVCIGCGTVHNRNENSAYNHLLAWKHSNSN